MRLLVEALVKAQQRPTPLEAVSLHLELVHSVDILNVHLGRGPIWSLRCP